jgi:hypothetical protein
MPIARGPKSVERRASNLLATMQRALWPLIRVLMHRGIGFTVVAEALKVVFIRVALEEFPLRGKRETDSRISVLTGIHRRDVKRLRGEIQARAAQAPGVQGNRDGESAADISLPSRVAALWASLPDYVDERGGPRPLPRRAQQGEDVSFEALVRLVSKDIRSRAVLDEWLRGGVVGLDEDGFVHLNREVLAARKDLDDKASYLSQNVHDHLAAIAHNLTDGEQPFLADCVLHSALTPESIAELAAFAAEESARTLQAVNRRALELKARDEGSARARYRMSFGVYFFDTARERRAQPEPATAEAARVR